MKECKLNMKERVKEKKVKESVGGKKGYMREEGKEGGGKL